MINQKKCAIYIRVSKGEQHTDNQLKELKIMSSQQNYMIYKVYTDVITGGVADRPEFQQMLKDARLRKFDVVLVWSLDRFSREGISITLNYIEQLKHHKVAIKSLKESWMDTTDDGVGELLISIMSWMAKRERIRISERTKAGLARSDKKPGRPKGSKDKKPRDNLGYKLRWSKKRVSKNA